MEDFDDEQPEPYRTPLPYDTPVVDGDDQWITYPTVRVGMENEEPKTEDDLTLTVKFTSEGLIADLFVSSDSHVGTFALTYEELANRCH